MVTFVRRRGHTMLAVAAATIGLAIGPAVAHAQTDDVADAHGTVTLITGGSIACPIPSGSEFVDSWGASRSGGRGHEGVDMIADRGTPVVAAQAGDVQFKTNSLGGNAAWLTTPDGDKFYYAHLDAFEGSSRTVERDDVIGYVGSTGNAQGPHLHFETHFDGRVGNPFDATYSACVQPTIDILAALDRVITETPTVPLPGGTDAATSAERMIDILTSAEPD